MRTNPLGHLLRAAALSAALIAGGAATALADAPGSYFPDEWRPKPVQIQVQAAPPAALAGMQTSCTIADAGAPPAAAMPGYPGHAASNRLTPGMVPARSGS